MDLHIRSLGRPDRKGHSLRFSRAPWIVIGLLVLLSVVVVLPRFHPTRLATPKQLGEGPQEDADEIHIAVRAEASTRTDNPHPTESRNVKPIPVQPASHFREWSLEDEWRAFLASKDKGTGQRGASRGNGGRTSTCLTLRNETTLRVALATAHLSHSPLNPGQGRHSNREGSLNRMSLVNKLLYAMRHGYDLVVAGNEDVEWTNGVEAFHRRQNDVSSSIHNGSGSSSGRLQLPLGGRSPVWVKVRLLQLLLRVDFYHYVLWIDRDAFVRDWSMPLEHEILAPGIYHQPVQHDAGVWSQPQGVVVVPVGGGRDTADLIMCRDANGINLGVFAIRNTEYSLSLLDRWWNSSEATWNPWQEQSALSELLGLSATEAVGGGGAGNDNLCHCRFPQPSTLNAYDERAASFTGQDTSTVYRPGGFIQHFPNCGGTGRSDPSTDPQGKETGRRSARCVEWMREAFTESWKDLRELEESGTAGGTTVRQRGRGTGMKPHGWDGSANGPWLQEKLTVAAKLWRPFNSLYSKLGRLRPGLESNSIKVPPIDLSVASGIWQFSHSLEHGEGPPPETRLNSFSVVEE